MIWRKFTIHTTTEAEDILSANLAELGIDGVQIEDRIPLSEEDTKGMFIDILPEIGPDDGTAEVSFYVEVLDPEQKQDRLTKVQKMMEDPAVDASYMPNTSNVYTPQELKKLLQEVQETLDEMKQYVDIGLGTIDTSDTEDKDWINNWKTFFHPFTVGDLLIKPTWEAVPEEDRDKLVIAIDPGTAFGTGMHETTQLCIRQLKKYVTPETRLLDVGTGSGILSILSLMFGAEHAVGTDLDICAVDAVRENCESNGINPEKFEMMIGNIITDKEIQDRVGYECYDIVVANILADVLVPLTPVIIHQLKPGGIYITSGIIDDKEQTVTEAVKAAGLKVLEVTYQGEWVSVTAQKTV